LLGMSAMSSLLENCQVTTQKHNIIFCERRVQSQVAALSLPKGYLSFAEPSKNHESIFFKKWYFTVIYRFAT